MLNSNIVKELEKMRNYVTEDGSIPVVEFSELELKDLRSLTPYKVQQVMGNNWLPNGLIAWQVSEATNKLNMIFFRGRAAVVTVTKDGNAEISELLKGASRLHHLENKRIVLAFT